MLIDMATMVPVPETGRRVTRSRPVRLGDVDPSGRLRFDALTRYTQDVSNDDTSEANLADDMAWVVRSTAVEVHQEAQLGEQLELTTFCGAFGRRWAQRRIAVSGDQGARYEVATLWVHLDLESGRPKVLSEQFIDLYGGAAQGREIKAKLTNPPLDDQASRRLWPTRAVDFDTLKHMNNAAYWSVVEEVLAESRSAGEPTATRLLLEYGAGIPIGSQVELAIGEVGGATLVWFLVDDAVVGSARFSLD